jgi:hypothetical protein
MVIIGCLALRTAGDLSEAGFKDLMKLAVNQQFKLFQSFLQTVQGAFPGQAQNTAPIVAKQSAKKTE